MYRAAELPYQSGLASSYARTRALAHATAAAVSIIAGCASSRMLERPDAPRPVWKDALLPRGVRKGQCWGRFLEREAEGPEIHILTATGTLLLNSSVDNRRLWRLKPAMCSQCQSVNR